MAEQQNIQIQSVQIAKINQSSKVNVRLNSSESCENEPEIKKQQIVQEKIITMNPQQTKEKSFAIRITKRNVHNLFKLPKVESQNKIRSDKILNEQLFINKFKRANSDKKVNKSKSLKAEEVSRDLIKHPMKYKIVQQLFTCRPQAIYDLKKNQIDVIQQKNTKTKGDSYLREALTKIKKQKQQLKTQPKSLSKRIKTSKANLSKLIELQVVKGNKVLKKVKKHLIKGDSGFYAYLDSSASVDKAFISFLKIKIKRVELDCIS